MEIFNLKKILKALLFSTSEALSIKDVQKVITRYHQQVDDFGSEKKESAEKSTGDPVSDASGQALMTELMAEVPSLITATQIRDAMEEIESDLRRARDVTHLIEGPHGYRLVVSPQYSHWIRLFREEPKPRKLSPAALETLTVIAYRQPVTRAEIEAIRGVSSDSSLNRLLEKELVFIVGRADLPGRPIQYGTTDQFLEYCGIRNLDELPASDVLSPNQLNEWIRVATSPRRSVSDKDLGFELH